MSTLFFVAMGLKIGARYPHMCEAGSRLIEGLAMWGTPVLVGAIVLFCKGRWYSFFIATILLVVVWLLADPYHDWAHGS